jgi:hypothetical protein
MVADYLKYYCIIFLLALAKQRDPVRVTHISTLYCAAACGALLAAAGNRTRPVPHAPTAIAKRW